MINTFLQLASESIKGREQVRDAITPRTLLMNNGFQPTSTTTTTAGAGQNDGFQPTSTTSTTAGGGQLSVILLKRQPHSLAWFC